MWVSPSEEAPEELLQELSNDLMSPFCPGRTIAACPSKAARQLEDEILAKAESGQSREQIEEALVQRYGSDIIGYEPPPLLLWGTIIVGLLALMALVSLGRRWTRRAPAAAPSTGVPGAVEGKETSAARRPTRSELDALDDALDEEEGF